MEDLFALLLALVAMVVGVLLPKKGQQAPPPQPPVKLFLEIAPGTKKLVRQEAGIEVTVGFSISSSFESARGYGYAYLARPETPFPTPTEFATIARRQDPGLTDQQIQALYDDLQQYFAVAAHTFHVMWALSPDGPFVPEQDVMIGPGQTYVYGRVLIPGFAIYNPVFQGRTDTIPRDEDYYVFSCAVSPAGTRDTQDVRREGVHKITIKELRDA